MFKVGNIVTNKEFSSVLLIIEKPNNKNPYYYKVIWLKFGNNKAKFIGKISYISKHSLEKYYKLEK